MMAVKRWLCHLLHVDRLAGQFRSCVNNLACTSSDPTPLYISYLKAVGIVNGHQYLCSPEARSGISVAQ